MNKVILIGNLGADPELRYSGTRNEAILRMRIATTEHFTDRNGQPTERTEWHSVTVFGRRAEGLSKILHKGRKIAVEGRLSHRSWEADDGTKKYATDVIATDVDVMPDGSRSSTPQEKSGGEYDRASPRGARDDGSGSFDDGRGDDIPF